MEIVLEDFTPFQVAYKKCTLSIPKMNLTYLSSLQLANQVIAVKSRSSRYFYHSRCVTFHGGMAREVRL